MIVEESSFIDSGIGVVTIYGRKKCMNTCRFCFGVPPEVSSWDSLVRSADYLIKAGVKKIELSGIDAGEHEKLVKFVDYLKTNGIESIFLATHGRILRQESLVSALENKVTEMKLSLYGSTAQIHNKMTQVSKSKGNAFEDTTIGIQNCTKYNIPIVGNIMPTQYNKKDLNNIVKLFLDLTSGEMISMHVRPLFIVGSLQQFTTEWLLPIKDMGPYLREVYLNRQSVPRHIRFRMSEIPYCVLGEYTDLIENDSYSYGSEEFRSNSANMSIVRKGLRADKSDNIPHYRVKSHFNECNSCILKDRCCGISLNEIKMFGTQGLKAIKQRQTNV